MQQLIQILQQYPTGAPSLPAVREDLQNLVRALNKPNNLGNTLVVDELLIFVYSGTKSAPNGALESLAVGPSLDL